MKTYKLTFDDLKACGYEGPPVDSGLRFPDKQIEKVDSIYKADVVIIPLSTRETNELTPQLWHKIVEHFKIDERRYVTFDCSDFEFTTQKYVNGTFIRSNLKGWMKRQMPRSIPWAWPVEDMKDCSELPKDGFKYKTGFHGWITSSSVRLSSTESCVKHLGKDFDYAGYTDFSGYLDGSPDPVKRAEWDRRRAAFKNSLKNCLTQLTPASIWNVFPYRFYEAMSAARVPVLFCEDYCLPFEDKIDWNKCIKVFSSQQAPYAGTLIKSWLEDTKEETVIEMGRYGREMWDKWLNRDKAPELMYIAVKEKFEKEGLLK